MFDSTKPHKWIEASTSPAQEDSQVRHYQCIWGSNKLKNLGLDMVWEHKKLNILTIKLCVADQRTLYYHLSNQRNSQIFHALSSNDLHGGAEMTSLTYYQWQDCVNDRYSSTTNYSAERFNKQSVC